MKYQEYIIYRMYHLEDIKEMKYQEYIISNIKYKISNIFLSNMKYLRNYIVYKKRRIKNIRSM